MIVWLASYPRSGNTLLRQILRQVFCQETFSRYSEQNNLARFPEVARMVGHVGYEGEWEHFYEKTMLSVDPCFIKTHEYPPDDQKTIYLVRDGRAATVSFFHFLHDLHRHAEVTMASVIEGRTRFGSWSGHLEAWHPLERPDTLLLQFENVLLDPCDVIDQLAAFTGLAAKSGWTNDLERLRNRFPGFFRDGSNEKNIAELSPDDEKLFWDVHGGWMRRLGYG